MCKKMSFTNFLHSNCYLDTENLVKYLIRKGADVNARDSVEKTSLHLTVEYGKSFEYQNHKFHSITKFNQFDQDAKISQNF